MVASNVRPINKIAYVFPGQGSQSVGMGYELYQSSPRAREVFEEADDALQFALSRLCFEGPEEMLLQTVNAQPAIMIVSLTCSLIMNSLTDTALSSARIASLSDDLRNFTKSRSISVYQEMVLSDLPSALFDWSKSHNGLWLMFWKPHYATQCTLVSLFVINVLPYIYH